MSDDDNILGMDHIGITVPDLDQASDFLAAALGAEVMYDLFTPPTNPAQTKVALNGPDGQPTDIYLDFSGAVINDRPAEVSYRGHRMMRLGSGATLELLQFDTDAPGPTGYADLGISHLCVFVKDMETAARRIEVAGGKLYERFETVGLEAGEGAQAQYAQAPWGLRIELMSYGSMAYEGLTPLRRTWAS